MTKSEKSYIIEKEKCLWEELLDAQKVYGVDNPISDRARTKWNEIYMLCKHLFPEYTGNETPAE